MIVIPQKQENPNSSAVVLDLGHLALVSDLRARRGGETESEIDKSVGLTLGPEYFYNKYKVNLKDVRASIIHNISDLSNQKIDDVHCDASLVVAPHG